MTGTGEVELARRAGGGMNYPANRTVWPSGALVVHDCDAKKPRMLMRVVAWFPDGKCQTEYVDAELRSRWGEGTKSRLFNPPAYLHDPALWGIPLDAGEDDPAYDRECPLLRTKGAGDGVA